MYVSAWPSCVSLVGVIPHFVWCNAVLIELETCLCVRGLGEIISELRRQYSPVEFVGASVRPLYGVSVFVFLVCVYVFFEAVCGCILWCVRACIVGVFLAYPCVTFDDDGFSVSAVSVSFSVPVLVFVACPP